MPFFSIRITKIVKFYWLFDDACLQSNTTGGWSPHKDRTADLGEFEGAAIDLTDFAPNHPTELHHRGQAIVQAILFRYQTLESAGLPEALVSRLDPAQNIILEALSS